MWKAVVICAALFLSPAYAFEVKGISPGSDVSSIDLKACRSVPDADSGMPGYKCDTTYAGAPATMTLVVANQHVIAVLVTVANESFLPTLQALEGKYGHARKPNQFIESYVWQSGPSYLEIEDLRAGRGYKVSNIDFDMLKAVTKGKAEKAKSDL